MPFGLLWFSHRIVCPSGPILFLLPLILARCTILTNACNWFPISSSHLLWLRATALFPFPSLHEFYASLPFATASCLSIWQPPWWVLISQLQRWAKSNVFGQAKTLSIFLYVRNDKATASLSLIAVCKHEFCHWVSSLCSMISCIRGLTSSPAPEEVLDTSPMVMFSSLCINHDIFSAQIQLASRSLVRYVYEVFKRIIPRFHPGCQLSIACPGLWAFAK